MKSLTEAIRTLDQIDEAVVNPKKYSQVHGGDDPAEYGDDLAVAFTKLHKDIKKFTGSKPRGTEPQALDIQQAIGNILGIK